ncbi:MAG: GGDEF domain-containing protein [Gammaproteobacteria bacterium]|nr:GGDEF domain-containing protein [Gammaproteobacteria bacterium]
MVRETETDSLEAGAARKVLRVLDALRQSQPGSVIYRQVERMLDELVTANRDVQQGYADIIGTLLDVYAGHLHSGSPLQVQVKLLRARLQPPLSLSDLQALRQYVEVYSDQIAYLPDFRQAAFAEAMQPLLRAFGIEEGRQAQSVPVEPVPRAEPETAPVTQHIAPAVPAEPPREAREWVRPPAGGRHPLADVSSQPTLRREEGGREREPVGDETDSIDATTTRHLDARRRDIQELQAGFAQQVLDTIAQNQEFGVLLEVVLNELRQASDISELENLRWTLIREIERLVSGHHNLADKLDSTHKYLHVIESDSRQLSDELTRVRLLSLTDELTGLPNRRAFLRRLEDEVARVQRYGFPLSLALMDLDKFKEMNDIYGHAGGDEVLRVYSKNILSIFRHHDLVARYGGEEFAVLLPNTESEGALRALNKVKNRCAETRWQSNGTMIPVPSFSAGLALYKPGETSTAFIERVDKALYRAKRLGRNRIEVDMTYQPDTEARTTQRGNEPS